MEEILKHPAIKRCLSEVQVVVAYDLPHKQNRVFFRFHSFLTSNPPPTYVLGLRSTPDERWYKQHVGGIRHVKKAISCVWYHRDNLCTMEESVYKIIMKRDIQDTIGNTTLGLVNTIRWDAEYQAFILSVRRCLDYLARALSSFFKKEYHSFRKFHGFLLKQKPTVVASAIAEAYQRHVKKFEYVMSNGEKKSTRDLLSHYKYISAGSLNLSRHGVHMVGGGEHLSIKGKLEGGLSKEIVKKADDLHTCIEDIILTFIAAVEQPKGMGT